MSTAAAAASAHGDVVAVDWSVQELEELRRGTAAPNAFYFLGRPDVLPLPDGSVDLVVAPATTVTMDGAVTELFRVLRSGGRLSLVRRPNEEDAAAPLNLDEHGPESLLSSAGFSDVTDSGARKP